MLNLARKKSNMFHTFGWLWYRAHCLLSLLIGKMVTQYSNCILKFASRLQGLPHPKHSLSCLCGSGSPDASTVYAFGFNKRGQLGIPMDSNGNGSNSKWRVSFPQMVDSLAMYGVASISANGDHSAALTGMFKQVVLLMFAFLRMKCSLRMGCTVH